MSPTTNPSATGIEPSAPRPASTFRRAAVGFATGTLVVGLGAFALSYGLHRRPPASTPMVAAAPATVTPPPTAPPPGSMAGEHPGDQPLPPELATKVGALEAKLRSDSDDLDARRELALTLLEGEQYMAAFRQAEQIEQQASEDADAMYVQSVVRLRMGQNQLAIAGLERVLAGHPDHVEALRALGLAKLRVGDPSAAVQAWERGLAAAGGHHPELERLLAISRAARQEHAKAG